MLDDWISLSEQKWVNLAERYSQYALSDIHKPIGVSKYQLSRYLPDNLKSSLPSIEELERELARLGNIEEEGTK
jgi:hypothetical protein